MPSIHTVDCRGQHCPAPILATARAARDLGLGGGTLEILADDDAFPLDLKSWCRSSGAALLELVPMSDGHRAIVRVGAPDEGAVEASPSTPAPRATKIIDCRGMQCPQPILELARAARANPGAPLEVLADDEAFELDVRSWCRSASAELVSLERTDRVFRALITPAAARASEPAPPLPLASPQPLAPRPGTLSGPVVDCRGMECPQPILEVARAARANPGASLDVLADDDAFELDIASWCRSASASLVSLERNGATFRAKIQLAGASRPSAPPVSAISYVPPASPSMSIGDGSTVRVDLGVVAPPRRLAELDRSFQGTSASKLVVIVPDRSSTPEILTWCTSGGHDLLSLNGSGPVMVEIALARAATPALLESPSTALALASTPALAKQRRATILVLHNDKEALLAALLVANGAAAQGMDVMLFFTFWGLNLLRGDGANVAHPVERVSWAQRLFKWLMPKGPKRQGLGKLNFGGLGGGMMNSLMRKKNIMDLPELLGAAEEQGVRFVACTMSMNVMGITKRDLHPYQSLEYGGVAAFVESASDAELSLVF